MAADKKRRKPRIEAAGVRFAADEVLEVVLKKDGREIVIDRRENDKKIGFGNDGKE